jgi:hypothetical protein
MKREIILGRREDMCFVSFTRGKGKPLEALQGASEGFVSFKS